jgi:hypothetical protein
MQYSKKSKQNVQFSCATSLVAWVVSNNWHQVILPNNKTANSSFPPFRPEARTCKHCITKFTTEMQTGLLIISEHNQTPLVAFCIELRNFIRLGIND